MQIEKVAKQFCLLSCLFLNACTGSNYSSHFDCPYGAGAGCASLTKVNKMIDRQEIDLEEESPAGQGRYAPLKKQVYIYFGPDQMGKVISIDKPQLG